MDLVPELQRAIGARSSSAQRFNLLKPLVEQMVISEAIAALRSLNRKRLGSACSSSVVTTALVGGAADRVLEDSLTASARSLMRERFAAKAEARFLERKKRAGSGGVQPAAFAFLARELYLQIESGESNFADLAKRYAEGPERNTNGIVGPVSLTQAHPTLVEKLRVAQPGVLLEPFRISDWWLVVRLERYSPATFTDEVSDQMCQEMFDAWIDEETAMESETTGTVPTSDFSDFSISQMTQTSSFPLLEHPAFCGLSLMLSVGWSKLQRVPLRAWGSAV